jgi:hypothetical protein
LGHLKDSERKTDISEKKAEAVETETRLFRNIETARASGDPKQLEAALQASKDWNLTKGKGGAASAAAAFDPAAAKSSAEMIANYQLAPMGAWAVKTPYGQEVMKQVRAINPNYSEPQYRARVAGEQTVGRRGATLLMASNAADNLIPVVQGLSAKVPRTNFPDINKILLAGKTKVGDADVVAFGQSLNSLLYVYMRALNPSGIPRVTDLERGEHMLQTAWSQGQLDNVLTQMKTEIAAEKTAITASADEIGSLFGTSDKTQALAGPAVKFDDKDQVARAYQRGDLTKDEAVGILKKQFGGTTPQ